VRNPARERSRNLNREVWESPSVYGGEDVNQSGTAILNGINSVKSFLKVYFYVEF